MQIGGAAQDAAEAAGKGLLRGADQAGTAAKDIAQEVSEKAVPAAKEVRSVSESRYRV